MKKLNANAWAGVALLIVSLVFLIKSFDYAYSSELGPGPGFFPFWLSAGLLVLSLIYIVSSMRSNSTEKVTMPSGKSLKEVLFLLGSMILFAVLLPYLGFIISSTLFLFALLFKAYKWHINLLTSAGVSVFLYVLFDLVLEVRLPVSVLGW
jgi:putative tricarboxylic transport membrane protein